MATVWFKNGQIVMQDGLVKLCSDCPCGGCDCLCEWCEDGRTPAWMDVAIRGVKSKPGDPVCKCSGYNASGRLTLTNDGSCMYGGVITGAYCDGGRVDIPVQAWLGLINPINAAIYDSHGNGVGGDIQINFTGAKESQSCEDPVTGDYDDHVPLHGGMSDHCDMTEVMIAVTGWGPRTHPKCCEDEPMLMAARSAELTSSDDPELMPCIYRGEQTGLIPCELCGQKGVEKQVFVCSLHGECVLRKYKHGSQIKNCLGCSDRTEGGNE